MASDSMVEARSAALCGHWVTDADRVADLTVNGHGALSRGSETSPEIALSAPIDWGSTGERDSEPILLDESSAGRQADTVSGSPVPLVPWKPGGRAKTKENLQTLQTNFKTGLKRAALGCPPERDSALYTGPEGVGGVAKLAGSSVIENRLKFTPLMRGNTESSAKKGLGIPALAFPHLKSTVAVWPGPGGQSVQE